jgi:hypothetical protein
MLQRVPINRFGGELLSKGIKKLHDLLTTNEHEYSINRRRRETPALHLRDLNGLLLRSVFVKL